MEEIIRRYQNDNKFNRLVNYLKKFIRDDVFSLQDIRDAVDLIAAQHRVQADLPLASCGCESCNSMLLPHEL